MPGKADDPDVMGQILAAELGAEADFLRLDEELLLEVDVTERAAGLVTGRRERVVILDAGQLDGQQVLFGRSATDVKKTRMLDIVCGTDYVRREFGKRLKVEDIQSKWMQETEAFKELSENYYLYR